MDGAQYIPLAFDWSGVAAEYFTTIRNLIANRIIWRPEF